MPMLVQFSIYRNVFGVDVAMSDRLPPRQSTRVTRALRKWTNIVVFFHTRVFRCAKLNSPLSKARRRLFLLSLLGDNVDCCIRVFGLRGCGGLAGWPRIYRNLSEWNL